MDAAQLDVVGVLLDDGGDLVRVAEEAGLVDLPYDGASNFAGLKVARSFFIFGRAITSFSGRSESVPGLSGVVITPALKSRCIAPSRTLPTPTSWQRRMRSWAILSETTPSPA